MNITIAILFMWLCIVLCVDPMIAMLFIEVEPKPEATSFVEDLDTEPRQQGKQPRIDRVDKNPIPSQSRLCINRMITLYHFYRIVEPISFAWPIILSQ